ncbi:MAG: hypothetical protein AAF500_04285 [Myxococcota bacterium]
MTIQKRGVAPARRRVRGRWLIGTLLLLAGCESSSAPEPEDGSFSRAQPGIVDPRDLVSPITGENTVATTADPCAVWDPRAGGWRVFFSFADFEAERRGLPPSGIFGGTWIEGRAFEQYPELAVTQVGTWDASSVETCEVVRLDDATSPTGQRFLLYYGGASAEEPNYVMALATSTDGEHFERLPADKAPLGFEGGLFKIDAVLPNTRDIPGNFVTDPTVVFVDGVFHMWTLCVRQIPDTFGGVCYSTSADGISWNHRGLVSGLSRGAPIQPTVFYDPELERFEMYVVMDTAEEEVGIHDPATNLGLRVTGWYRAVSTDGTRFVADEVLAFGEDLSFPFENAGLATGADAALRGDQVFLFYPSFTTEGQGHALPGLLNWPLNVAVRRRPF